MVFEQMHSLVAACLSLEACTLHWTGVFQQTETLQVASISNHTKVFASSSWSRFLTCLNKPQDDYKLQMLYQGTTWWHLDSFGGILRQTKFTSSKRWRSQRKSRNWEKEHVIPVLSTEKWCSATQNWFLPTMTTQEVTLIRTKMNQNDKSSGPGCWRCSVFASRPGEFGSYQLHWGIWLVESEICRCGFKLQVWRFLMVHVHFPFKQF